MTEQRNLKKLVRDRAARTGESYMTAHRQVTGRSAAPAGGHRDSALLAGMLRQAGVNAPHTGRPYSEAMIAGLAGGIGFLYATFAYAGHPTMTIVAQHHPDPWLPTALEHLGLPYDQRHSTSAAKAMADLRVLLADRPVYCTVDRTRLPWQRDAHPWTAAEPYGVVVTTAGDAIVSVDDGRGVNEIADDGFVAAWTGHRKGRHHRLVVGDDAATVAVDLPSAVRRAIRLTVGHLTGPVLGHSFDVNFGLSGMAKLAEQLGDPRGRAGWARSFDGHLDRVLRRLDECLEREYTAPGATRPLYAAYLTEAAPLLGGDADAVLNAAGHVAKAGAAWSTIARLACEPDASARLAELAAAVDEARSLEVRAVEALAAV